MHIKRQHERVKEFKCNSCEYAAFRSCDLKKHIKAKHKLTKTDEEDMKGIIKCKSENQAN